MKQPINRDQLFLQQRSQPATPLDAPVIQNLQDTLAANADRCVGMAANMIGVAKRIIIVQRGPFAQIMVNPVLKAKQGAYQAQEGCLSLAGERPATRYQQITVAYQDASFKPHVETVSGFVAQIIQHEMDHLEGILI